MDPDHKLCMIPGPIEIHEDVRAAMATPATSHVGPGFVHAFGEALELVRHVVLTKTGQPFIIAGSGTLGWDMTASNLVEPGENVLVLNTGYFGDRIGECLATYGAKVDHVRAPFGDRPSPEQVRDALKAKQYKLLTVTHVDTSTAVLQNVKEICAVTKEVSPATLIAVDGVCSVASEELRMDDWGVDVVMTASQKGLGCPPGLCVLVASQRAVDTFKNRKAPVANYYAGWPRWLPIMKNYEARKASYFATPAVPLVYALLVSLRQIVAQGMDRRFAEHVAASNRLKDTFERWGLKMLPVSREKASNSLTAVYYGDTVVGTDLLPKIAANGAVVAGGLHLDCAAKYFRVGHMGISVTDPSRGHIDKTLHAVEKALQDCRYNFRL